MIPHLPSDGNDPLAFIQQQQIAVATHQLEYKPPLDWIAGATGEVEADHPFKVLLLDGDQGQLPQAVLGLLGQSAAAALFRWGWDLDQPRAVRPPTQFKPHHALQGAGPQLQGLAIGLLGFLKATGQDPAAQVVDHRPQGGEIHDLG